MECPLVWYQDYDKGKPSGFRYGDCLKEECAWWFAPTARCSILELVIHIREADARLGQLVAKMPPGGE